LEEERKEREAAAAEARKRAEEAEAAKLATKVANLPAGAAAPPSAGSKDPTLLARSPQSELKRVGCDPGPADGNWGEKSANALRAFARAAKISISEETPTEAALNAVTGQKGRICTTVCSPAEREQDGKCVSIVRREPSKVKLKRQAPPAESEAKGSTKMCFSNASGYTYMVPCSAGAHQR
jgi:peptidoglycan hydrolase-like protein with peptidoglycan-binding domain